MSIRLTSWLSRPSLLVTLLLRVRLAVRLLREPCVPLLIKPVPLLALLYVISPIDVLPDFLPVVGQLDDVMIMLTALEVFSRLCPTSARAFHEQAIARGRAYSPMPRGTTSSTWSGGGILRDRVRLTAVCSGAAPQVRPAPSDLGATRVLAESLICSC